LAAGIEYLYWFYYFEREKERERVEKKGADEHGEGVDVGHFVYGDGVVGRARLGCGDETSAGHGNRESYPYDVDEPP
jgi:hypothetical protein